MTPLRADVLRLVSSAVILAAALPAATPAAAGPAVLAPHRAIYELKLGSASGKRQIEAVRGRILYDFSGSVCEGYSLQFRQVSELDSGEGKAALSDLRATSWEDGAAKSLRFSSQNYLDQQMVDTAAGNAERQSGGVAVKLTKPEDKSYDLEAGIVFPAEHMRRIIEAAEQGKSILELPVFDGSENGEKVFNTLTVIGHIISPEKKPTDVSADNPATANLRRWPVTVSYFEKASTAGEQTPSYAIGFELFENGISRALSLNYGDFVVNGELTELDMKTAKPCN